MGVITIQISAEVQAPTGGEGTVGYVETSNDQCLGVYTVTVTTTTNAWVEWQFPNNFVNINKVSNGQPVIDETIFNTETYTVLMDGYIAPSENYEQSDVSCAVYDEENGILLDEIQITRFHKAMNCGGLL